jgi:hypothetical protein
MTTTQGERRQLTEKEYFALLEAQGVPTKHYAFRCVNCGHIQSFASLARHMPLEETRNRAYFACEGRFCKDEGCDWTLGGLFTIHTLEVVTDGGVIPSFEPATPEEAKALMLKLTAPPGG